MDKALYKVNTRDWGAQSVELKRHGLPAPAPHDPRQVLLWGQQASKECIKARSANDQTANQPLLVRGHEVRFQGDDHDVFHISTALRQAALSV